MLTIPHAIPIARQPAVSVLLAPWQFIICALHEEQRNEV